ncbi:MAG: cytochrome b/b6 domain-containing protein [Burkholderiales bacterium]|jgi:cytochrome b subunit of formate dehydrogenase|nr:cytochrome b/b6 domain-containing protein [Burkholderiales bacterium]
MSSVTVPAGAAAHAHSGRYYRRFQPYQRLMHAVLMFTFIGCTLTGLPLLFPYTGWARGLVAFFGGFEGAALIHRISAGTMGVVFLLHVLEIVIRGATSGSFLTVLWGPNSMVPQGKDIRDMVQHVKFFLGKGERPQFDRYTYWEKFDYMAVFWGMFIIGGSGLLLWFPEFWGRFLPGWVFNVATIVHGHEALLAIGFIFTIHFFNGHLRPEKFPMDPVVFTGVLPEHELKDERPLEYERAIRAGTLKSMEAKPPSAGAALLAYVVGGTGLVLGLLSIVLIFIGLIRG